VSERAPAPSPGLPPLPAQPPDVPWPTGRWPEAEPEEGVDRRRLGAAADELLQHPPSESHGETLALLAVHRGRLVLERYAPGRGPEDTFPSWSMAKSILHAAVGRLLERGRLSLHEPAALPAWSAPGDPRGAITLEHLLRMVDGLDFAEDYVDARRSDVIEMLFGEGRDDVAGYAAARPAAHPPGSVWSYSSGTSNLVAAVAGRAVGGGREGMARFLREEIFAPLGMRSAEPRFDAAGTFIGSSFVFASARDFARFGLLYLRDGTWEGKRWLPAGWVDHARTPTPASRGEYGAHWWLALDGSGTFHASGYRGQYIAVVPRRDLVLVRLGLSTPEQRGAVLRALRSAVESFPEL